jgi:hypothetical protein
MKEITLLKRIKGIISLIPVLIHTGCASLHAYMYILTMNYDGNAVISHERDVQYKLKQVIENADQYTMKAYTRAAISYKIKKTNSTMHSFYVIRHEGGTYQTLSFSATGKWTTSEGAWAINTDSDISSYEDYLVARGGGGKWCVEEIETIRGIDTLRTIINVVEKIESDVTYYYRALPNKDDKVDNCNKALLETLVEN